MAMGYRYLHGIGKNVYCILYSHVLLYYTIYCTKNYTIYYTLYYTVYALICMRLYVTYMCDVGVAESCDSALRHYEYAANHVVEQIVSTYIL